MRSAVMGLWVMRARYWLACEICHSLLFGACKMLENGRAPAEIVCRPEYLEQIRFVSAIVDRRLRINVVVKASAFLGEDCPALLMAAEKRSSHW